MFQTPRGGRSNYKYSQSPSPARGFNGRPYLVERIGDNNVVADGLHVERHEVRRQFFVDESFFMAFVIAIIPVGVLHRECCRVKCGIKNIHTTLGEVSCVQESLAFNEPSVVLTMVTAFVEGGIAPGVRAMVGFHPAIVPSIVEKRNKAGASGANGKSV